MIRSNQPTFGGDAAILTANLIRQLKDQNKQDQLAKQKEAQIRQQVLQELQATGCLNGSARFSPPVRDTFQASPKPTVYFGIGDAVWNSATGNKNEQGLSTCVSNADPSESWSDVGKTRREKRYLQAKKEWKEAKADSDVDEEEKERLKAKKQELKPGAKTSKKRAERVNTALSLGTAAIPGPLGAVSGFVTKPVASALVDLAEDSDSGEPSNTSHVPADDRSIRARGVKGHGEDTPCVVM